MSEKYFENFWDCPYCGNKKISALRHMKCTKCGASKPPQYSEYYSNEEITDEYGLMLAKGGANWSCSACGSTNLDKDDNCHSCGTPKGEAGNIEFEVKDLSFDPTKDSNKYKGSIYGSDGEIDDEKLEEAEERHEDRIEDDLNQDSYEDNYSNDYENDNSYYEEDKSKKSFKNINPLFWIIPLVLMIVGGGYWLVKSNTHQYQGEITDFSWETQVEIQEVQKFRESGWTRPSGAYNVSSRQKIHHYDPIYENQTKTETYTDYVNNGNGSTKAVTKTRTKTVRVKVGEKPVYKTWYDYDINKWKTIKRLDKKGTGQEHEYASYVLTNDFATFGKKLGSQQALKHLNRYYYIKYKDKEFVEKDQRIKIKEFTGLKVGDEVIVTETFGNFIKCEIVKRMNLE